MLIDSSLNTTQLVGMIAFGAAAAAAGRAAMGCATQHPQNKPIWWTVSGAHLFFVAELVLGMRHVVHDFANGFLRDAGIYPSRGAIQMLLLVVCALAATIASRVVRKRLQAPPDVTAHAQIAAWLTLALGALFMVEAVSLHAVDAWLYSTAGPVLLIAYLWATVAMAVVVLSLDSLSAK